VYLLVPFSVIIECHPKYFNVSTWCCSALSLNYNIHRIGFLTQRNTSTFAANLYSNFNQKQMQTYQVHDEDLVEKMQAGQVVHK